MSTNENPTQSDERPAVSQGETESIKSEDVRPTGCLNSKFCHPSHYVHRYMALALMCFMGFGNYFVYDNPGALQDQMTSDMSISTSDFATLYSLYSWPNVVLSFFGGFLIDRVFGIRLGAIIFASFICVGSAIVALGAFIDKFWMMQVGRFVFGIGGENLAVTQNTYAVSWFKGHELNTVFGLQLSFARVGSTVNFNVMGPVYQFFSTFSSDHICLGFALFFATATCVFSLICAIALAYFDRRAEKILNRKAGETGEVVRITDAKDFSLTFWLICLVCVTYYATIFPFIGLGTTFFRRKYVISPTQANAVDSVVYIISAVLSPVFGMAVDFTGRNLVWVLVSVVITLISHAIIAFSLFNPWFPMSLMGIGYSLLACALWPMVSLVIPENKLGTAYGTMQAIQNLGLAIAAQVAGVIVDSKGYIVLELFFLICLCLSTICVILLFICDINRGGLLNMSKEQRKCLNDKIEAEKALEHDKLSNGSESEYATPQETLQPQSDSQIRNRYLSKLTKGQPDKRNEIPSNLLD